MHAEFETSLHILGIELFFTISKAAWNILEEVIREFGDFRAKSEQYSFFLLLITNILQYFKCVTSFLIQTARRTKTIAEKLNDSGISLYKLFSSKLETAGINPLKA